MTLTFNLNFLNSSNSFNFNTYFLSKHNILNHMYLIKQKTTDVIYWFNLNAVVLLLTKEVVKSLIN